VFSAIFDNYHVYEYWVASAQLFLAMLGMGALLTPADFVLEVKKPTGLIVGLSFQWILVPLAAVVVGVLMPVPMGIAAGLILVAAVPGGTLSNILTLFGRGNIALSISLTSITTVAALVTTPLLLQLLISQHLPADFSMPTGRLSRDIFITLIIPLMIGMGIRHVGSVRFVEGFAHWVIRLSLAMILVMAFGAGGSGRLDPNAYGVIGIVALFVFCVTIQGSALLACRVAGMKAAGILAIVVEVGFRNLSLAVAVKAIVFPAQAGVLDPIGDAVLFTVLLYGGVSMFMSVVPVIINRRIIPPPSKEVATPSA